VEECHCSESSFSAIYGTALSRGALLGSYYGRHDARRSSVSNEDRVLNAVRCACADPSVTLSVLSPDRDENEVEVWDEEELSDTEESGSGGDVFDGFDFASMKGDYYL